MKTTRRKGVLPPHLIHNLASATVGDAFMHKISKSTLITQDAYFFPDFSSARRFPSNV